MTNYQPNPLTRFNAIRDFIILFLVYLCLIGFLFLLLFLISPYISLSIADLIFGFSILILFACYFLSLHIAKKQEKLLRSFAQKEGFIMTTEQEAKKNIQLPFFEGLIKRIGPVFTKQKEDVAYQLFHVYVEYVDGEKEKLRFTSASQLDFMPNTYTVLQAKTSRNFKNLVVANIPVPEQLLERISPIKFESNEFNKKYYVKAEDASEAYYILDPVAILKLNNLNLQNFALFFYGNFITILIYGDINKIEVLDEAYGFLEQTIERIISL